LDDTVYVIIFKNSVPTSQETQRVTIKNPVNNRHRIVVLFSEPQETHIYWENVIFFFYPYTGLHISIIVLESDTECSARIASFSTKIMVHGDSLLRY
jgi:hypothetical protein